MNNIQAVTEKGQSIWIDYIDREFMESGELENLIEQGLRGLTSNPTIFQKAIANSDIYDKDIRALAKEGKSEKEIFEELAVEDITRATELFMPVYKKSEGKDGFVSLEVSPDLAHRTSETIVEAMRLFKMVNHPNVMIKVPATKEGFPAITELIGSGINVNVTLIFGLEQYQKVIESYMNGLEKLSKTDRQLDVASVASFFVSRVDTAVDELLDKKALPYLKGKTAIANSKIAYSIFQEKFAGPRWNAMIKEGAQIQRLLWGSTSTKNPTYPDTHYVDNLIGPHTVNTMPLNTYEKFKKMGKPGATITKDMNQAKAHLNALTQSGIILKNITDQLLEDGVKKFTDSYHDVLTTIREKKEKIAAG